MTDVSTVILNVSIIWFVAVLTPGPSVLLTLNTALSRGRSAGVSCASGTALGAGAWGIFGFTGLLLIFNSVPWFLPALRILGGCYLLRTGIHKLRTLFSSDHDLSAVSDESNPAGYAAKALVTSLLNPKTGLFVISLFAVAVPENADLLSGLLTVILMTGISFCWHTVLATVFSGRLAQSKYYQFSKVLDAVCGGLFSFFGIRLLIMR